MRAEISTIHVFYDCVVVHVHRETTWDTAGQGSTNCTRGAMAKQRYTTLGSLCAPRCPCIGRKRSEGVPKPIENDNKRNAHWSTPPHPHILIPSFRRPPHLHTTGATFRKFSQVANIHTHITAIASYRYVEHGWSWGLRSM